MNRKLIGMAAALVLALVGTLLLVGYVRSAEARALAGEKVVEVLVVTERIASGTAASELEGSVRTEQVPVKVRADGAVTDLADLQDKVPTVELLPGEQVVLERFVAADQHTSDDVPEGMHQVTLELEPTRALGGRIAAGDTVAVMASIDDLANGQPVTRMVLQKVRVTAVQREAADAINDDDDGDAPPTGKLLVTLALDGPSVGKVVFAAEHGRVWLSAQPDDAPISAAETLTKVVVFP